MRKYKYILLLPLSLICLQNLTASVRYSDYRSPVSIHGLPSSIKKRASTRSVTKFACTHKSARSSWFNKLKREFANSNIAAAISNKSKFNMSIRYSGFNSFGIKVNHVVSSICGNSKQPDLNIGLSLLAKMQVKVSEQSSKWVKYVVDSAPTTDTSQVSSPSITYRVNVSGSKENEKVIFVMSYELRNAKATDKKKDVQLGHFDVYNKGNNVKHKLSKRAIIILIALLVALLILIARVIGTGFAAYGKRASINAYFSERALRRATRLNGLTAESPVTGLDTSLSDGSNQSLVGLRTRTSTDTNIVDGNIDHIDHPGCVKKNSLDHFSDKSVSPQSQDNAISIISDEEISTQPEYQPLDLPMWMTESTMTDSTMTDEIDYMAEDQVEAAGSDPKDTQSKFTKKTYQTIYSKDPYDQFDRQPRPRNQKFLKTGRTPETYSYLKQTRKCIRKLGEDMSRIVSYSKDITDSAESIKADIDIAERRTSDKFNQLNFRFLHKQNAIEETFATRTKRLCAVRDNELSRCVNIKAAAQQLTKENDYIELADSKMLDKLETKGPGMSTKKYVSVVRSTVSEQLDTKEIDDLQKVVSDRTAKINELQNLSKIQESRIATHINEQERLRQELIQILNRKT